jgi:hypothetical protein
MGDGRTSENIFGEGYRVTEGEELSVDFGEFCLGELA